MNQTKNTKPSKPFFARFLSVQELQQATGGAPDPLPVTQKYPSDWDDETDPTPTTD